MGLTSEEAIEMIKSVSSIGVREGKLAALREVREMVKHDLDCNTDDSCRHMARHLMRLNSLIKHEEEK